MPRRQRFTNKTKKRKTPTAAQDEGWYIIRSILKERTVHGKVEYLVDWEDDPVTGASYAATWSKSIDVTDEAKREWAERNTEEQQGDQTSAIPCNNVAKLGDVSDASESPRPAHCSKPVGRNLKKHRRLPSSEDEGASGEQPRKQARLEYNLSPSAEPAPSFTSASSIATLEEDEHWVGRPATHISVEIPKALGLDASEYHSVHGSQSTAVSSHPVSELESQDQRIALASNPSQGTIPDSQEFSCLSTVRTQEDEQSQSLSSHLPRASEPQELPTTKRQRATYEPLATQEPPATQELNESLPQTCPDSFAGQDESNVSKDRAVVNSTEADWEIPSHQVSHSANSQYRDNHSEPVKSDQLGTFQRGISQPVEGQHSHQQQTFRSASHPGEARHTQREEASAELAPNLNQEGCQGSSNEAGFLTQPDFSHILGSSHTSSVRPNTSSQAGSVVPGSAHSPDPGSAVVEDSLNSRLSQAAQVTVEDLESSNERPLSGNSSAEAIGQDNGSSVPSPASQAVRDPSDKQSPRPVPSTPARSASDIVNLILETPDREEVPRECIMVNGSSESSPPPGRTSAVTELQSLWEDDHPVEPSQPSADAVESSNTAEPAPTTELRDGSPQATSEWSGPPLQGAVSYPDDTVAPSSIMQPPRRSAVDELQDILGEAFGNSNDLVHENLVVPELQDDPLATISPAEISKSTDLESATLPLLPSLQERSLPFDAIQESSGDVITMGQVPLAQQDSPVSTDEEETDSRTHLITLPFQASIRALYDETLLKYRKEVTRFGEAFTNEIYVEPDAYLVKSVDQLLTHLQNMCDYPQDILGTALKDMSSSQRVKYSLDANPKLNFVYELLQGLEKASNLLIIARSANILGLIGEVANVLGVDYSCASKQHLSDTGSFNSVIRATLALPDEEIDVRNFDVVVAYDYSFRESRLAQDDNVAKNSPMFLSLVTAYSLEHIDLHITGAKDSLERKNALLFGIVKARDVVSDPPPLLEPHEVAKNFYDYINGEAERISWEPNPIPEHILDVYFNSQAMSQLPAASHLDSDNGRKRKLDDDEGDGESKKLRTAPRTSALPETDEPPLPEEVQSMLDKSIAQQMARASSEMRVSVPLGALEVLAEKIYESERAVASTDREAEYAAVVSRLEKQVKDHERTASRFYDSNRNAIQDRTQFEAKARKAESSLQMEMEKSKKSEENHQARVTELQATITRLTEQSGANTAVGDTETQLQAAKQKVQALEKRLETSHKNEEYTRKLYQDASSSTTAMRNEIDELKARNAELQKQSSANLKSIHEIQAKSTTTAYLRQIAELQTQMSERENELDRMRDELRQLKNGRRETRQVSVPRSPRMGIMSPRPPRAMVGAGVGVGGPVSRGASPGPSIVPGFDVAAGGGGAGHQSGNGRWTHLRD